MVEVVVLGIFLEETFFGKVVGLVVLAGV